MSPHALHSSPSTSPASVAGRLPRRLPVLRLLALLLGALALVGLSACSPPASSTRGAQVVALARTHLGAPYVYGAAGPYTFDCSGLTSYVYRQAGVGIPRTVAEQRAVARPVAQAAAQPGDLIFFGTYHVGIYVGGGQMIDAPKTGDRVKQQAIWTSAYTVGRF